MKKTKNNDPLDWIHKVREENYKKTKNMSPKEYIDYINKKAKLVTKKLKKSA